MPNEAGYLTSSFRFEFKVAIERDIERESQSLGLDLRLIGLNRMFVMQIKEGLIASWNREHPDQQVKRGHRILEVNGVRSDVSCMLDVMREHVVGNCDSSSS